MGHDVKKGDWVQIRQVILEPGQRAPQVPEDTSKVPLISLIKGFVTEDASMGDTVTIETVIDRKITGELVERNSSYDHSFGHPPAGFTGIGVTLRRIFNDAR